ncbi:uncharacterized protein LOC141620184 [Silene latifolia]|uniref:uncharacterized protein LOC141620184 n=1 Tax=Silene latifolia TaxID=37657 RepID=UPI003D77E847
MFPKTLILDNSKLNIGAGLTFRHVKELVNGYENIGATLIDFKNFQRDIKCYIGLRDADLFIDRLEKLKATQPQFYFAYDVDSQNRLTKFFWADATCIRNYSFFGDAVSFDPTYGTNKDTDFLARFNAVVWDRYGAVGVQEKWRKVISDFELEDNDWLTTMFQIAMDQQRYTRRCDDYNKYHSFPELKTELPIEKHGAIIYTHAVFKVFQEEVMAADSCGVDAFEKEEHVRIIHGKGIGRIPSKYIVDRWLNNTHAANRFDLKTLLQRMILTCNKNCFTKNIVTIISYKNIVTMINKNSFVLLPGLIRMGMSLRIHIWLPLDNNILCNVWSEFRQIVGVLKTLPVEHTEELASLLVEFRQKLCIEPLTKDQEMEMLLGCSSSSEVTIHPPEQARNKGSGKRLKSAKQQAIEKANQAKEAMCIPQRKSYPRQRTCPLRIGDVAALRKQTKKKKV